MTSKNEKRNFDVYSSRESQFSDFLSHIDQFSPNTQIQIIPDVHEFDCIYPLPIPKNALGKKSFGNLGNKNINISCSPNLFSFADEKIKIGYVSNDALFDVFKQCHFIDKEKKGNKRAEAVHAVIEQYSLYPVPGKSRPFDVSKIDEVCYGAEDKPDIVFFSSILPDDVQVCDGVIAVNFQKTVPSDPSSGKFAYVKVDKGVLDKGEDVSSFFLIFLGVIQGFCEG